MNATFTASDGLAIAFDRSGEVPALICLAGLTRNRSDFNYVRPHLRGVGVVRMDYRSHLVFEPVGWTTSVCAPMTRISASCERPVIENDVDQYPRRYAWITAVAARLVGASRRLLAYPTRIR